jgi:hypothetical protein
MRKLFSVAVLAVLLSGCATQSGWNGAAIGGGVGAVSGAIIDRNSAEGAVVGGIAGAVIGGVLGDQSELNRRDGYDRGRHDGRYDNRRYDNRRYDDRRYQPRPSYNGRCGCYGYYDQRGYFHPAR